MFFILLLFYFIILSVWLIKWKWIKHSGIKSLVIIALFAFKALTGFALVYLYGHFYDPKQSDIYIYFNDALHLKNLYLNQPNIFWNILLGHNINMSEVHEQYIKLRYWDSSSIDFLIHEKRIVILLNVLFGFISASNIYIHSLFMSFIGFLGQLAIFRFVKRQSQINPILILLVTFLLPTFILWSSSILKEPLIIFSIGFLLFFIGKWVKNWKLIYLVSSIPFFILAFLIKPYVLLALCFPIFIFILFKSKENFNFKKQSLIVLGSSIILIFTFWLLTFTHFNLFEKLSQKQNAFYETINLSEQSQKVGSQIEINKLYPSLSSLIYNTPKAFSNVMFKPGLYNFTNPLYLPDLFQNLLILIIALMLIFKYRIPKKEEFPFIWLSLLFVLILYITIGLVTPILGAIVRYKIPALIFVFFFLLSFLRNDFTSRKVLKYIFYSSN